MDQRQERGQIISEYKELEQNFLQTLCGPRFRRLKTRNLAEAAAVPIPPQELDGIIDNLKESILLRNRARPLFELPCLRHEYFIKVLNQILDVLQNKRTNADERQQKLEPLSTATADMTDRTSLNFVRKTGTLLCRVDSDVIRIRSGSPRAGIQHC
jgi:hypothetical protein